MARSKPKKALPAKRVAAGKKPSAKAGKKPAEIPLPPAVEEAPADAPQAQADQMPSDSDGGASESPEPTESSTESSDSAPRSRYATAETMAKAQRSISVSEFFAKNRHLLGFDNPRKALLTAVKEAVDNSLDACEEAGIPPRVEIWIEQVSETHFRITVQDNGPGIVRKQIPNIFGKLLYGSKFHRLRMSRGQQGIGISAAGMYGVLTTGVPVKITSRTGPRMPAHYYELQIDTSKNRPDVSKEDAIEWDCPHGTRVSIELEARYQRGRQSVDDYLEQTAIANPHVTLVYHQPDGQLGQYDASVDTLPLLAKAIRPHPYGIELGVLLKMLGDSSARTVQKFLTAEFSRVSPRVAKDILDKAGVELGARPNRLGNEAAKRIYHAIQGTKIMAPATDCVVPVGEEQLISGLRQVVDAAFYVGTTRSPAVYRGNPFIIEAALAYGRPEGEEGQADAAPGAPTPEAQASECLCISEAAPGAATGEEDDEDQQLARLMRFANRVPLLYQQSACAIYKSVVGLNWKSYGLPQGRGALPTGPLTIVVHMASVWVPFTSESKEAIASYPEILKEIRLALQDCGRKLGLHIRKGIRQKQELKKRTYIEKYIPAIGEALRDILDLKAAQVTRVCADLKEVLEKSRRF
jgi:DNA topoisomerase-6 subunit B